MELHYSKKTDEIINIEDRLRNMTLAFTVIISDQRKEPAFIDGSKEYLGIDKMNIYLDQLDREKEQWLLL